ncbi:hypothetical protein TWF696_008963 [Orbilia brochopaga]|uniref:Uncharacterized protein n=1 Tax=Orbilia brochopaga TaxID=3140254 RepID=A0AAV9UH46_9PEZI
MQHLHVWRDKVNPRRQQLDKLLDKLASMLVAKGEEDCVAVAITYLTRYKVSFLAAYDDTDTDALSQDANISGRGNSRRREQDISSHAASLFDFLKKSRIPGDQRTKLEAIDAFAHLQIGYSIQRIAARSHQFTKALRAIKSLDVFECSLLKMALHGENRYFVRPPTAAEGGGSIQDEYLAQYLPKVYLALEQRKDHKQLRKFLKSNPHLSPTCAEESDIILWHTLFIWLFEVFDEKVQSASRSKELQDEATLKAKIPEIHQLLNLIHWSTHKSATFREWISIVTKISEDSTAPRLPPERSIVKSHAFERLLKSLSGRRHTKSTNGEDVVPERDANLKGKGTIALEGNGANTSEQAQGGGEGSKAIKPGKTGTAKIIETKERKAVQETSLVEDLVQTLQQSQSSQQRERRLKRTAVKMFVKKVLSTLHIPGKSKRKPAAESNEEVSTTTSHQQQDNDKAQVSLRAAVNKDTIRDPHSKNVSEVSPTGRAPSDLLDSSHREDGKEGLSEITIEIFPQGAERHAEETKLETQNILFQKAYQLSEHIDLIFSLLNSRRLAREVLKRSFSLNVIPHDDSDPIEYTAEKLESFLEHSLTLNGETGDTPARIQSVVDALPTVVDRPELRKKLLELNVENPRVYVVKHAELMLLAYVLTEGKSLQYDYIGTSKPPCFVCEAVLLGYRHDVRSQEGHGHIYVTKIPDLISDTIKTAVLRTINSLAIDVTQNLYASQAKKRSDDSAFTQRLPDVEEPEPLPGAVEFEDYHMWISSRITSGKGSPRRDGKIVPSACISD